MRALLLSIVLAVSLSGCAEVSRVWDSPEDLRVAFHATRVADAGTTMLRDPACMSEGNPFLGPDPSNASVALYALAQSGIYELIYHSIEDHDISDRLAMGRMFFLVGLIGPVANAYTLSRGCN